MSREKPIIMKRVCVLCGSPRREGNTNQLVRAFVNETETLGCETEQFFLYDMELRPCLACRACQKDWAALKASCVSIT